MSPIEPATLEAIWNSVAPDDFSEAALQEVPFKNIRFKKLHLPRRDVPSRITICLGFSLYGRPRFAAYRYRLVLLPEDILGGNTRWQITRADIASFVKWARHMKHVVTFSTLKSGASFPLSLHAQSFPMFQKETALTALAGIATDVHVGNNEMPHFPSLEIATLRDYPLHGIKITSTDTNGSSEEMVDKTYELALNYDALKAFNIVILPESTDVAGRLSLFFFPRRRDGRAIFRFHGDRWQIAALEANGLLQAKTVKALTDIKEETIADMFNRTGLNDHEFKDFLRMLETF
jgi:hypothetical protein